MSARADLTVEKIAQIEGLLEGWRLAPTKVTAEMEEAHFAAHAKAETVFASVQELWDGMLAASPPPPSPPIMRLGLDLSERADLAAWVEFAANGNVRRWTSDRAKAARWFGAAALASAPAPAGAPDVALREAARPFVDIARSLSRTRKSQGVVRLGDETSAVEVTVGAFRKLMEAYDAALSQPPAPAEGWTVDDLAELRRMVPDLDAVLTHNPVHQVFFRAGLLACREYMARFVEQGGDTAAAASIRANWWPSLGDDPGAPRRFNFDEVAVENSRGGWDHADTPPSIEALPRALQFLESLPAAPQTEETRS
ncbi:hypothetical protein [Hansschlegelia sp.]|uniref:hypothetical protein n=1 Tax=Hansschlegelia sp. TaxID=2041892 RepID=UPI002CDA2503|nr:hypothetical protein [Hansschlegelia sp.]HVI27482.1 hypothetical protein [Hansschlegelia sp.]